MSIAHETDRRIPPSTLGLRLQQSRDWRGHTQTDLAVALDVSRGTISNYERGISTPSRLQINAWAAFCDVEVDWLKTGDETPTTPHDDGTPSDPTAKITEWLFASHDDGNVIRVDFGAPLYDAA